MDALRLFVYRQWVWYLEDLAPPATLLGVFGNITLIFVAINKENMRFAFPFIGDFGDRYYSNLKCG